MTAWDITIAFDRRDLSQPLFRQLARFIALEITRGRLSPGSRLPGTRALARQLAVSRQTVAAAYESLISEGWLRAVPASGTFVTTQIPHFTFSTGDPVTGQRPNAVITATPQRRAPRHTLDLSSGQPDLRALPTDELSRAFRRALRLGSRDVLGYADPAGNIRLRQALAHMLSATRGVPAGIDNLMVTAGSQMAFNLAARALLRPGDVIAVEELGYRPAWAAFEAGGARLHPIPIDDEGIVVDRLHALSRRERVRAVYVTPHRQYPTTVTMPASRRLQLLEFAARHGVYVIEDDYDHEFHYTSPPVAPLASLQAEARVVYVGTLSKAFAPGVRLGFVAAAADLVDRMIECRAVIDLHGAHVLELAIAILFEDGSMQRHMNRVRRLYAARRDLMAAAVTERLSPAVRIMPNSGGLGMWCPVDPRVDVEGLAYAARQHDVQLHTGRHYSFGQEPVPAIRLSFAPLSATQIRDGIDILGNELRRAGCA